MSRYHDPVPNSVTIEGTFPLAALSPEAYCAPIGDDGAKTRLVQFDVSLDDGQTIAVVLDRDARPYPVLSARCDVELDPGTQRILVAGGFLPDWAERLRRSHGAQGDVLVSEWRAAHADFERTVKPMCDAARQLASLLRQFVPRYQIRATLLLEPHFAFSSDGMEFSQARFPLPWRVEWSETRHEELRSRQGDLDPTGLLHAIRLLGPVVADEQRDALQRLLDQGRHGFHSLRFLLRACEEPDPESRWIFAATAAELGIKEFLVAQVPELEHLIELAHGPSVDGYYTKVLQDYGFKPLPKSLTKPIQEGASIRNKLVHRLRADRALETSDVESYVNAVRDAIAHLFDQSPDLASLSSRIRSYSQLPMSEPHDVTIPEQFDAFDPVRELERRLGNELADAGFLPAVDYGEERSTVLVSLFNVFGEAEILDYELRFEDCFDPILVRRLAIRLRTAWDSWREESEGSEKPRD